MTRLGKYELLEQLGRGGYGTVYRARETVLDVESIDKIFHTALAELKNSLRFFITRRLFEILLLCDRMTCDDMIAYSKLYKFNVSDIIFLIKSWVCENSLRKKFECRRVLTTWYLKGVRYFHNRKTRLELYKLIESYFPVGGRNAVWASEHSWRWWIEQGAQVCFRANYRRLGITNSSINNHSRTVVRITNKRCHSVRANNGV